LLRESETPKKLSTVNISNSANDPSIVFQSQDETTARPLAPPEYRQRALRSIIGLNHSKGSDSLSFSELALQLRDPALRDNVDPAFEPFSSESIRAAVADLIYTGELVVDNRTVIFPKPTTQ
jgi:hypothetical protein